MQIIYCMIGFVFAQSKVQHYGNLEFIQNKNQWNKKILYKTDIDGGAVFLEKDGFTFVFKDLKAIQKLMKFKNESPKEYKKPTPKSQKSISNLKLLDGIKGICLIIICFTYTFELA